MKFKQFTILVSILFFLSSCNESKPTQKSIKEALTVYAYDNMDKAILYYHNLKETQSAAYNFKDENELNALGYQLINENRVEEAIKIFELLVLEFPNSFNAYDSLGEAYFTVGNSDLALKNYRQSLELNPNNENAERYITKIAFNNRDKTKFDKVYAKQAYLDDLEVLAKDLTTINPHPYRYMTKEAFWNVVNDKKALITEHTTYSEFIWHCSELVANINCSHSSLPMYFEQETEMFPVGLRFPLEVYSSHHALYIADGLVNKDKISPGAEILTINGKKTVEIIKDIYKHIATQGHVESPAKRHLFNWRATVMIPYALGFPKQYEITVKGQESPIVLDRLESYEFQMKNLNTCHETFCLDFIGDQDETALLTFKHWDFYGGRFSIIKTFMDESFKDINSRNIKNLIIDVRGNGGGNSWATAYLLQYLAKKPFTYFKEAPSSPKLKPLEPFKNRYKGRVYFISDGRSGSSTGQLLALAKHHEIGDIIGEESNGGILYTGGQKMYQLPNTGVFYAIGKFKHVTMVNSISDEGGVLPHHQSIQTIEDYFNGIDTAKTFTLEQIDQH